ncbi:MAG: hypothetical protein ACJ73N_08255 [Bryobacteraceae bacterium]
MPLHFPVPPKTDQQSSRTMAVNAQSDVTVFRDCYQRFQECLEYRDLQNSTPLGELAENYLLDFDLTAKRAIGDDAGRYRLFQLRYLKGANRQDCCKTLKLEIFSYASEIIQIERIVGRALAQRGLFPLTSYFSPAKMLLHKMAA